MFKTGDGYFARRQSLYKNPDVDPKTPELQENVIVVRQPVLQARVGITTSERIIRFLNQNRFRRDALGLCWIPYHGKLQKLEEIYKSRTQEEIQERASGTGSVRGTFPATI